MFSYNTVVCTLEMKQWNTKKLKNIARITCREREAFRSLSLRIYDSSAKPINQIDNVYGFIFCGVSLFNRSIYIWRQQKFKQTLKIIKNMKCLFNILFSSPQSCICSSHIFFLATDCSLQMQMHIYHNRSKKPA